jgi:hypothetical protein
MLSLSMKTSGKFSVCQDDKFVGTFLNAEDALLPNVWSYAWRS